jgi:flagellar biosynthetic protein FliR
MIFDALIIAGQTISMGMGLGFAMMVDPQRGVSVPVIGQFFVILGMLIFLALGGHLATLRLIADSFAALPLGVPLPTDGVWVLVTYGSEMFAGALRIALPAATALLVVNIAFGVMSRAAPTLNLFAVGLPAGLLIGFLILLVNIEHLAALMATLLESSLGAIARMLAA